MGPNPKSGLNLPIVKDQDICWAASHLGLKENAFHGKHGNDPRSDVLKTMESIDVAACPGSGKTTLLVAKLAIFAENWPHRTQGICVLSHTNRAREVIEAKLGNTKAGRSLLAYPHFVGTIHGFVNTYLTLPILRSLGYRGIQFDTEISAKKIWRLSNYGGNLPKYLYRQFKNDNARKSAVQHTHYVRDELDIKLESGNHSLLLRRGKGTEAFKVLDKWKCEVLRQGYLPYEDTFAYAHSALKEHSCLQDTIRDRFPFLFIDEAQDNSEEQSAILHRIFIEGGTSVIRQRFGDSNQAIYNNASSKAAETDNFPGEISIDIPNSHRFDQSIADLADPLGLKPVTGGLVGHGPAKPLASGEKQAAHTILLFDNDSANKILDAYAKELFDTFSDQELSADSFSAIAIGQVHRPPDEEKEEKFPLHVGHYWPEYDCELSKSDPKHHTFVRYITAGQALAESKKEAFPAVEKIAEAILRLATLGDRKLNYQRRRHKHRLVSELLTNSPIAQKYQCLIHDFAIERSQLTKSDWDTYWRAVAKDIAESISECELTGENVDEFMCWDANDDGSGAVSGSSLSQGNIYYFPSTEQTRVKIRVGSIHSVKGDESSATLVLETFWNTHNLNDISDWITGSKIGSQCTGIRKQTRLKLHYVAMTRPTHLLCLAMKRSTFENDQGEINGSLVKKAEEMGWNIKYIN